MGVYSIFTSSKIKIDYSFLQYIQINLLCMLVVKNKNLSPPSLIFSSFLICATVLLKISDSNICFFIW